MFVVDLARAPSASSPRGIGKQDESFGVAKWMLDEKKTALDQHDDGHAHPKGGGGGEAAADAAQRVGETEGCGRRVR